jgi:hypothetical protein
MERRTVRVDDLREGCYGRTTLSVNITISGGPMRFKPGVWGGANPGASCSCPATRA